MQLGHAAFVDGAEKARDKGARDGEVLGHVVIDHVANAKLGIVFEELVHERVPPQALVEVLVGTAGQALVQLVDSEFGLHVDWKVGLLLVVLVWRVLVVVMVVVGRLLVLLLLLYVCRLVLVVRMGWHGLGCVHVVLGERGRLLLLLLLLLLLMIERRVRMGWHRMVLLLLIKKKWINFSDEV